MKSSLNSTTLRQGLTLEEFVSAAGKAGFKGVELRYPAWVELARERGLAGARSLFTAAGVEPASRELAPRTGEQERAPLDFPVEAARDLEGGGRLARGRAERGGLDRQPHGSGHTRGPERELAPECEGPTGEREERRVARPRFPKQAEKGRRVGIGRPGWQPGAETQQPPPVKWTRLG